MLEDLVDKLYWLGSAENIYSELTQMQSWDIQGYWEETVLMFVRSNVSTPWEVYSRRSGRDLQLSAYGEAIAKLDIARAEPSICTAQVVRRLDASVCDSKAASIAGPVPNNSLDSRRPLRP